MPNTTPWSPPSTDPVVPPWTPPASDPVVSPEDLQKQVQQGYQQSGQLNAEAQTLTHGSAEQQAQLINSKRGVLGSNLAEVLEPGQQIAAAGQNLAGKVGGALGFPEFAAREAAAAQQSTAFGANPNLGFVQNLPGALVGGAAKFVAPAAAGVIGGAEALNQDEAARQAGNAPGLGAELLHVGGSAVFDYALGKVFNQVKGGSSAAGGLENAIRQQAAKALPEYLARYGAKGAVGALANDAAMLAQQELAKHTTQPGTQVGQGLLQNTLVGAGIPMIHEALGGEGPAPSDKTPSQKQEEKAPVAAPEKPAEVPQPAAIPPKPAEIAPAQVAPAPLKPPTLPYNAASMDAGQLRKVLNDAGVPIDRTIIADKMAKQQMTPRQAMLQYAQERMNPGTTAPLPETVNNPGRASLTPETEPGYNKGGLGEGSIPIAPEQPKQTIRRVRPPLPEDIENWSNRQVREWLQNNGYQPKVGVGLKPLIADAQQQAEAAKNQYATESIPPEHNDFDVKNLLYSRGIEPNLEPVKLSEKELQEGRENTPEIVPIPEPSPEAKAITDQAGLTKPTEQNVGTSAQSPAAIPSSTPVEKAPPTEIVKAVTENVPKEAVPPETFNNSAMDKLKSFHADESGGLDLKRTHEIFVNGTKAVKDYTRDLWDRLGNTWSRFAGGEMGRSLLGKRLMGGLKKASSGTNLYALRRDALYKPYLNKIDELMSGGKQDQVYRLFDEIEAHQAPSDPAFRPFAKLWHEDGVQLKKDAVDARIEGAQHFNPDLIGRKALPKDAAGKAAWEEGYKAPEGPGENQAGLFPRSRYGRRLGPHEDFIKAAEAQGLAPADKNPLITAIKKRLTIQNRINGVRFAREAEGFGGIRKLSPGDRLQNGEVPLKDEFFNPSPRRFTADARGGLLATLNDQKLPLPQRLAAFRQGIKDGTITELPPAEPNEVMERYGEGIHVEPGESKPGQVYEKYKQGNPHATGEFGQTQNIRTGGTFATGEHASGKYNPTYHGTTPEGHGLVDDALAQADTPRYAAKKEVADILNGHLDTPLVDPKNPIFSGWNSLNHTVLTSRLAFSAFHYLNLGLNASGIRGASGINSLLHGRVGEAATAFKQAIPIVGTKDLISLGKSWTDTLANDEGKPGSLPHAAKVGGGIIEQPESFKGEQPKAFPHLLKAANKALFESFGDNLRRGIMHMALKEEVARAGRDGLDPSSPEYATRMQKAISATFNSFDTLRKDSDFQNKAVQTVMRTVFAFPRWQLSRLRNIGQSIRDIPSALRTTELSPAQKVIAGDLLATALAGGIANTISTGKPPESAKDFFYPMIFGQRSVLPGPLNALISLVYEHAAVGRYLYNQEVPGAHIAGNLYDYMMAKHPKLAKLKGELYNSVTPTWAQPEPHETTEQYVGKFFGVNKAPKQRLGR